MALEVLTRSQAPYLSLGKWICLVGLCAQGLAAPLGSLGEGSPGDPGARKC